MKTAFFYTLQSYWLLFFYFILCKAKTCLCLRCEDSHGPFFYVYFLLYVVTAILHTIELPVIVSLHRKIWTFSTAIAHCRNSIPSWNQFFLSLSQCHYIVHTLQRFNHFLLPLHIAETHTPRSRDSSFQWVPPLSPLISSYHWKYIIQRTMLLAWEFYYLL